MRGRKFGHFVSEETKLKISKSRKGYIPWNKGLRCPIISIKMIGNINGKYRKNVKHSEETREKLRNANIGKKHSEQTKEKMRLHSQRGEKNINWNGGSSFESYGHEFNFCLKESIRDRDKRVCTICKKSEIDNNVRLTIHHVDYNKKNNNKLNLVSLCVSCHTKTTINRDYWLNYFKNKLLPSCS